MQRTILTSLAAAALLLSPTLALAENDENSHNNDTHGWYNQQGQWQTAQQHDRRGENEHRNRGDRRENDNEQGENNGNHYGWNNPHNPHSGRSNSGYNNGYGRNGNYGQYGNNGNRLGGTVSSFSPYNLYLTNGTHVELHDGTVINPTGATPQPGQNVYVVGHWNSDGTFAADQVVIR